jgi:hypothetical protein
LTGAISSQLLPRQVFDAGVTPGSVRFGPEWRGAITPARQRIIIGLVVTSPPTGDGTA